jgi:hypothetical protein
MFCSLGILCKTPTYDAMSASPRISVIRKSLPGKIYVLSYEEDEDRAVILQNKGLNVAFGSVDAFVDALTSNVPEPDDGAEPEADAPGLFELPIRARAATLSVAHEATMKPQPQRLFNGGPATYADIEGGLTIEHTAKNHLSRSLRAAKYELQRSSVSLALGRPRQPAASWPRSCRRALSDSSTGAIFHFALGNG